MVLFIEKMTNQRLSKNNCNIWYIDGKVGRKDGLPAVIYEDGSLYYYKEGLLHRDGDYPAIICPNGRSEWYIHGFLHRNNNKPAIIHPNGDNDYYVQGQFVKRDKLNLSNKKRKYN